MSTLAPRYDNSYVRRRIAPYFEFSSESHYPIKTMNFSELFRQSHQLCRFSPDGKYLVSTLRSWDFLVCERERQRGGNGTIIDSLTQWMQIWMNFAAVYMNGKYMQHDCMKLFLFSLDIPPPTLTSHRPRTCNTSSCIDLTSPKRGIGYVVF